MSACCCTGKCRMLGGSCSAWPYGYGKLSPDDYNLTFKDRVKGLLEKHCEILESLTKRFDENLNALGDLSIRLNKMQSSLREFEKQKVNPKFEEVKKIIDKCIDDIDYLKETKAHAGAVANEFLETQEKIYELEELIKGKL